MGGLWSYDVSEFVVFTLVLPAVIIMLFYYISCEFTDKIRRKAENFVLSFVIYCIGFEIVSLFDDYSWTFFYLCVLIAAIQFLLAFYGAGFILMLSQTGVE